MLPALIVAAIVALIADCGGSESEQPPPPEREKPEHPEGGVPLFGEEGDAVVEVSSDFLGASFDLYVRAEKSGKDGCGILRVHDLKLAPGSGSGVYTLLAAARWASDPPSGQAAPGVAYRAGDFPISWITEEYPDHGTLGLKYAVTGSYDMNEQRLRITLENIDAENGNPSGIFLSPVYESWTNEEGKTVACQAQDDFGNEFLVAATAREIEISLSEGSGQGMLCQPCPPPVDRISLEIP